MGKKQVKTKCPNPRKALRRALPTGPSLPPAAAAPLEKEDDRQQCNHCSKDRPEIDRVLSKILSTPAATPACEFCREEPSNKRGNKQKIKKRSNSSSSGSKPIWVCLDCGRHFCGGDVSVSEPYGHARRHAKQEKHSWAVKFSDPIISWCFTCNSTVNIELPELAAIDEKQRIGVEKDVGDNLGGNVDRGSVVRGLANLGNTCFMNSVLQNLFAVDMLRDHLARLDRPAGPATMALKKLFAETSSGADLKGVLSPKSLFGCICAKAPQFRGYQQQDSHEFLCHLFDALQSEEISAKKSNFEGTVNSNLTSTFVDAIFGGQLSSSVCCMECSFTSIVHELFLDLSLPIPTKKDQPRKAPVVPPKKNKQLVRGKNKSRRFQEKEVCKKFSVVENQRVETVSNVAENQKAENYSSSSTTPEEQNVATDVGDSFSWLDYLEPNIPNHGSAKASSDQCSDNEQIHHNENDALQTIPELPENTCFVGPLLPPGFYGETNIGDEFSSSAVQDAGVILLPYMELDATLEGINKMTVSSQDSETSHSAADAPSAQPEQVEEDFSGFGDMFNEPEVTSVANRESNATEDMDVCLWGSNIDEYNQDDIDDSSSPVSIHSCMALFTKPELLSDEHAWYCERCSEISSKTSETSKANGDENVNGSIKDTEESSIGNAKSAEHEGSCNGPISALNNNKVEQEGDQSTTHSEDVEKLIAEEEHFKDPEYGYYTNGSPSSVIDNGPTSLSNGSEELPTVCRNEKSAKRKGKIHLNSNGRVHAIEKSSKDTKASSVKVKRDATKRILISKAPPVLIVHLKRFSQDIRGRLNKLSGHVDFQETLDLRSYTDSRCEKNKCLYRLIGVVEHSGTMRGGHYIAYIRRKSGACTTEKESDSRWFYASDAHIRETSLAEVLRSDAYILFYERVNL